MSADSVYVFCVIHGARELVAREKSSEIMEAHRDFVQHADKHTVMWVEKYKVDSGESQATKLPDGKLSRK